MRTFLSLIVLGGGAAAALSSSVSTPASTPTADRRAGTTAVHCQVPCGIYGDKMRIDMLLEDAATIEKAMEKIEADDTSRNQMVRWVTTKEQHAQKIQDRVAAYWLTQRIKAPEGADQEAKAKYHRQLSLMHGLTVAAMKCKQTTDAAHVEQLRSLAETFSETYFSDEDLEHLKEHAFGRGK